MNTTTRKGREVIVDVREQLRAGKEPFSDIMAAAQSCAVGDTLVLFATFKPVPLLMLLKGHGFEGEATKLGKGDWRVDFRRVRGPEQTAAQPGPASAAAATEVGPKPTSETTVATAGMHVSAPEQQTPTQSKPKDVHLDNRGLEPPEPMVRTLEEIYRLQPGQRIVGKFDRTPRFLLPKLDDMGYSYEVEPEDDGRATVTIWHGSKSD